MTEKNEHAVALASLGAAKGGLRRASRLDPEERSAIAQEAAIARWGTTIPRATHSGELVIGEYVLTCFVLENGTRVLSQETFLKTIGRAGKAKGGQGSATMGDGGLPPFLAAENLQDFITDDLRQSLTPVVFRTDRGVRAYGYDAHILPAVCRVYLMTRIKHKLWKSQEHIANACSALVLALADVGIVALIDEVTGYQEERANRDLRRILEKYIQVPFRPWVQMFPPEFFREIYRLMGWEMRPGSTARTHQVGNLINKYVYEQLPPGVLDELQRVNPVIPGKTYHYRRRKHHQHLTPDTGNVHLDKQISAVMLIMRMSDTKAEFERNFEKVFGAAAQLPLPHRKEIPLLPAPQAADLEAQLNLL